MSKPFIIAVAGSWHTTACLDPLLGRLRQKGFEGLALQHPSVGFHRPVKTLHDDIQNVREKVEEVCDTGRDVIVIAHSYGGCVVGSALDGLGKKERAAKGLKGGVIRIAFIAAFLIPNGKALVEIFGLPKDALVPQWLLQPPDNITALPLNPAQAFYHDLEPSEQEHWVSLLLPQAIKVNQTACTAAAYLEIPSEYLLCEDDRALPAAMQQSWVDSAIQAGADIKLTKIDSSHSPFLSQPEAVVNWIVDLAGRAE